MGGVILERVAWLKSQADWEARRFWQLAEANLSWKAYWPLRARFDDELNIVATYGELANEARISIGSVQQRLRKGMGVMVDVWQGARPAKEKAGRGQSAMEKRLTCMKQHKEFSRQRFWKLAKEVMTAKQLDVLELRYNYDLEVVRSHAEVGRALKIVRSDALGRLRWGLRSLEEAWGERYG